MDPVVIKVGYLVRAGGNLPAGTEGQIVGYGPGGIPVAVDLPSGGGYDDTAIRQQIAALTARIAALEGGQPVLTAPAAFTSGQWTLSTGLEAFQIVVSITELPSDGGSEITELQYDAGAGWVSLVGVDTGPRTLTVSESGTAYDVQIRAVNAIDPGTASDTKAATSGAEAAGDPIAGTLWIGAFDDTSVDVTAALMTDAEQARIVAQPVGGGSEIVSDVLTVDPSYDYVRTRLTGLTPGTEYDIRLRSVDGVNSGLPGWVKTRPATREAFKIGFGSCSASETIMRCSIRSSTKTPACWPSTIPAIGVMRTSLPMTSRFTTRPMTT